MLSRILGFYRQKWIVKIEVEILFFYKERRIYTYDKRCLSTIDRNFKFIKKFEFAAITAG